MFRYASEIVHRSMMWYLLCGHWYNIQISRNGVAIRDLQCLQRVLQCEIVNIFGSKYNISAKKGQKLFPLVLKRCGLLRTDRKLSKVMSLIQKWLLDPWRQSAEITISTSVHIMRNFLKAGLWAELSTQRFLTWWRIDNRKILKSTGNVLVLERLPVNLHVACLFQFLSQRHAFWFLLWNSLLMTDTVLQCYPFWKGRLYSCIQLVPS